MDSISALLGDDHDRLDAILAQFLEEDDLPTAKKLFAAFDLGLRAHIDWEEDLLFPAFEEKTRMTDSGPTVVMRMEHAEIKQHLLHIQASIGTKELASAVEDLLQVLFHHNQKEERILYPWIDRALSPKRLASMIQRIKSEQEKLLPPANP